MHGWEMLTVGLCASAVVLSAMSSRGMAEEPQGSAAEYVALEFPYSVEDTQMTILELAAYEGPFWEDGSGEELGGVAALVVKNTGGTMIHQGKITLCTDLGTLEFMLSWLPPNGTVLIPECSRAPVDPYQPWSCSGWNTTIYPEMTGAVTASEQGLGELVFLNHTMQPINSTEAFYKFYDEESCMYIGGNTFSVKLEQLQPGEERVIAPPCYACGYAKVVCILQSNE